MGKFDMEGQPRMRLLSEEDLLKIHNRALSVLAETGVKIYSGTALEILANKGAEIDYQQKIAKIPEQMVLDAINTVPQSLKLYDRKGENFLDLGGDNVHFDPGSAAIKFMEADGSVRNSISDDLIKISRLTDYLDNLDLQSSSVVLYDIPKSIGDCYRLYLMLKNSTKPIITGAFSSKGITYMHDMLVAVAGSEDELRARPRAVFDICPSPPLKWTEISSQNIIDCARYGLPIETISMPMPGAASPATIAGSVVLHTAETLSGIVLAQSVNPGTPMVYGGAPVNFDMRVGTTPMSAIEATMIGAAYGQMGKYYGMPTHTYACLSDAKTIDAQAGLETAMSGIVAQLAGINIISGPGILDFVGCLSLEKLAIDNDICGMALRLNRGLDCSEESLAVELIKEVGPGGDYLTTEHTMNHFRDESYFPSKIIDRSDRSSWENEGKRSSPDRARELVAEILENHQPESLAGDLEEKIDGVMKKIIERESISELPHGP